MQMEKMLCFFKKNKNKEENMSIDGSGKVKSDTEKKHENKKK